MNTQLFDKTDKGRDEIATRKFHLAPRMRTLLLLVDGKSTADQLLLKVAGLGLTESALIELLDQQFIKESQMSSADEQAILDALIAPISASETKPDAEEKEPVRIDVTEVADINKEAVITESTAPIVSPPINPELQPLHEFFSATIKSLLGLSGAPFQLKADSATSLDDFKAMREPYLAAIQNAGGPGMARILGNQLDLLLQQKH